MGSYEWGSVHVRGALGALLPSFYHPDHVRVQQEVVSLKPVLKQT
jgi:hypothetical protein